MSDVKVGKIDFHSNEIRSDGADIDTKDTYVITKSDFSRESI